MESEFNLTCFFHGRCSVAMWCPDDIGRDSWFLCWATHGGESMILLPGNGWSGTSSRRRRTVAKEIVVPKLG